MATVETKYDIGQVVFFATARSESRRHPCPDCNGVREWQAISPIGRGYVISCPRCSTNYLSEYRLHLGYREYAPHVERITICEVHGLNPVDYMASETSSGDPGHRSGSIYNEDRLFASEADAMHAAQLLADQANATARDAKTEMMAKPLGGRLISGRMPIDVNDYHLEDARLKLLENDARSYRYQAEDFGNKVGDVLEEDWLSKPEMIAKLRALIGEMWSEHPAAKECVC